MSFSWKTARNIMRKDQGISSDVQRLEELISLVFLRIYDALEEEWEDEAENDGREFNSVFTEEKYKWRNWALPDSNGKTLTGDELLTLVDDLFKYCKNVNVEGLEPRQRIIRKVFSDLNQYMKNGTNLRELVDVVNELNYHDAKQRNLFGQIYEEMLKLLQSAGSAGEFYTPRAVTKFIVEMLNPRVGETFGDFACGTGGFLTAAIDYFHEQKNVSNEDVKKINNSIFGFEYKPFPYLLCNTNLLVHGIDTPQIEYGSAFCKPINDFDEKEKVNVIAMNPPYGGVTTAAELTNFPAQFKTSETAVLFIAYITKRLKQNGRAGVIIPDGFLFGNDGASVEVKRVLLEEMNLHTIIRLPSSVFAPYTSITTNILFFDNKKPSENLWIYRMDMPEDLKHFSKTKPISDEHMEVVKMWWNNRSEMFEEGNEKARCFKKSEIAANGYNLDLCKYPKDEEEILSPKELINHFETVNSKCISEIENIFNSLKSSVFDNKPINTQNLHTSCFTELSNLTKNFQQNLKKSILQEAITGQLTETWRKTANIKQSGKQLLDRIIQERNAKALAEWEEALKKNPKAKKPVPVVASEIEEEEIPFEVPESWCWCRLGDVIDLLSGRDLEPSSYNSISKGIPYMTGASNFENEELIVNRWTDKPATISNLGDLLITCKGTVGELAFNHVGDVHIARQIMAIRKTDFINLKFLKLFLMGRIDEIQKQAKSMIPGISREDMLGFNFPLPPLEEQEEIVRKVEELLPLCK